MIDDIFQYAAHIKATAVNSTLSLTAPMATDLYPVTVTNNTPSTFTLGTTIVIWTDGNGNSATTTQNVIVQDQIPPHDYSYW